MGASCLKVLNSCKLASATVGLLGLGDEGSFGIAGHFAVAMNQVNIKALWPSTNLYNRTLIINAAKIILHFVSVCSNLEIQDDSCAKTHQLNRDVFKVLAKSQASAIRFVKLVMKLTYTHTFLYFFFYFTTYLLSLFTHRLIAPKKVFLIWTLFPE